MIAAETRIKKKLTFEDYLLTPETKLRYEVIDGEIIMSPAPTVEHQWIIGNLNDVLRPHVKKRKLGVVLSAPLDVIVSRKPLRTRQSDILYVNFEHSGKRAEELREMKVFELAPDLAIEILSPDEKRQRLKGKLHDYIKIGVRECWVVSPQGETVEVIRLSADGATITSLFKMTDTLRSEVLPDLKMKVSDIFSDY
jgi:Uma2 family endonuclease